MQLLASAAKSGSPYRLLWPILKKYRWMCGLALVALLLAAATTLLLPTLVRQIADAGSREDIDGLRLGFIQLMGCALLLAMTSAFRFYMVSWLGERVVSDIRQQLFSHLLALPMTFFDKSQSGELLSRLTTDTTLVERVVGTSVSMALRNSLMLLGSLVMLFVTSMKLSLLVLMLTPIVIIPIIVFSRRYRTLSKESQSYIADASAYASGVLGMMGVTKAYQYERYAKNYFGKVIEDGFWVAKKRILSRAWLTLFVMGALVGALCLLMWFGLLEVIQYNTMSGGALAQFFVYAIFVATASATLAEVWGDLMRARGAMDRILLLMIEPSQAEKGEAKLKHYGIGFEKVSFVYPTRQYGKTLNAVSFTIPEGSTTALVGQSGAGKSTIFKLLMQFYTGHEGMITVGGQRIETLSLHHLRENIAFVGHNTAILSASIRDNVTMGEAYTDEEIRFACEKANIADFIADQPDGYETLLGERGVLLSEGQRQRIALARAILRDAPIVLLDEATNALDAITEEAITQAIAEVFSEKTVIVIAHRLATVVHADQIVVMDQGSVESFGTHEALLKTSEIYKKLAKIQLIVREDGF